MPVMLGPVPVWEGVAGVLGEGRHPSGLRPPPAKPSSLHYPEEPAGGRARCRTLPIAGFHAKKKNKKKEGDTYTHTLRITPSYVPIGAMFSLASRARTERVKSWQEEFFSFTLGDFSAKQHGTQEHIFT